MRAVPSWPATASPWATRRPSSATRSALTLLPVAGPKSLPWAVMVNPTDAPGSTVGASGSTCSGASAGSFTSQRSAEFQKRM